jgi:hypothetical protein
MASRWSLRICLSGSCPERYWNTAGEPLSFGNRTLVQWRELGQHKESLVADPLFVSPENRDFHFKTSSPAKELGFEPWDDEVVGRRMR